jgi:acetoin utilization deacetylase AcuC-like enzyme
VPASRPPRRGRHLRRLLLPQQRGHRGGNGTQAIFYDRAEVLFCSLHGHPAQEYPYFLGYEDETGAGAGEGFNRNYPLRWGTGWDLWSEALAEACTAIADYGPALGRPTLFVMEGGYAVEEIGVNAVNVLIGFEEAA